MWLLTWLLLLLEHLGFHLPGCTHLGTKVTQTLTWLKCVQNCNIVKHLLNAYLKQQEVNIRLHYTILHLHFQFHEFKWPPWISMHMNLFIFHGKCRSLIVTWQVKSITNFDIIMTEENTGIKLQITVALNGGGSQIYWWTQSVTKKKTCMKRGLFYRRMHTAGSMFWDTKCYFLGKRSCFVQIYYKTQIYEGSNLRQNPTKSMFRWCLLHHD